MYIFEKINVALVSPFPPPYGGMAQQAKKLLEGLRSYGIYVFAIDTKRSFPKFLGFVRNIKGLRTIIREFLLIFDLIKSKDVGIVHILGASNEYFFLTVVPTIVYAKIFNKKTVLNYRGGELETFLQKWSFIALPVMKCVDVIVVPSLFLKNIFIRNGFSDVKVIPNIADLTLFPFKERKVVRPRLIITRHLEVLYNIPCAIKAFKLVKEAYPDARMKIVGSGSQEEHIKKLAADLSLKDVGFLGSIPHEDLPAYYNESDILINSSDADNFPGSILEAFACGLPVVTTNVGGIPYMVRDGETGLLSEINDSEGLAKRIIRLLDNPDLAHRLSLNGYLESQKYSWNKIGPEIIKLYKNLRS